MKKLTLSIIFACSLFFANAQDQSPEQEDVYGFLQEEIFVEGNFQLSSIDNKITTENTTNVSFNPKVGYFISNDFALGIQAAYGFENRVNQNELTETEKNNYTAGLFGRYYFLKLWKRLYTYGELGGTYSISDGFFIEEGEKMELDGINTIAASLNLGINFFATKKLVISFNLSDIVSYTSVKASVNGAEPVNTLNADVNILNNFFQTAEFGVLFLF